MKNILKKHINSLKKNGITNLGNIFSKKECLKYKNRFEKLFFNFENKHKKLGNKVQALQNYFFYDQKLLKLLYIKKVDEILQNLIDKDYVLISSSLINRFNRSNVNTSNKLHIPNIGDSWHQDSRIIGGRRLDRGFSYNVIIMFDDFKEENGSTQYIEKSHLIRDKFPQKNLNYSKYKNILGKAGSVSIIDTGLWHRGGKPSYSSSRWSIFSYYGPWFMKPYYDFPSMFKNNNKLDKKIKKLLHFNSTPPKSELKQTNTLTKLE